MRLHIITNEKGEVIATAPADKIKNIRVRIEPIVQGHKLHESVELPDNLRELKNVDEFHMGDP